MLLLKDHVFQPKAILMNEGKTIQPERERGRRGNGERILALISPERSSVSEVMKTDLEE